MNAEPQLKETYSEDSETTSLEILTGYKRDGKILKRRLAGYAYLPVGSDVYEVKLMMFPRHSYFLRRNHDSSNSYTVFSKRAWVEGDTKLSNPIGFGTLSKDSSSIIEIYFPLLGRVLFLDLLPKNF